jgi:hypothetical protein
VAATTEQDWHAEALELRQQHKSEREIAEAVGKAPSTVHSFLASIDTAHASNGSAEVDAARLRDAAGITADEEQARVIPGQTDIHGGVAGLEEQAGPGERVTPLQDDSPARPEQPPVDDIIVAGTTQLGLFDAGGKKPSSASLRLTGGKVLLVDGQALRKGDVIRGHFTAVVREVAQRDKPDPATGIVVSAEQKHSAQITDLTLEAT